MYEDENDGLVALQERLEEAEAAVKATTTAMRNKNKFMVPGRDHGDGGRGSNLQGPCDQEVLAETAREARRKLTHAQRRFPETMSQTFGSKGEPARTETSGQKKSEPTEKLL